MLLAGNTFQPFRRHPYCWQCGRLPLAGSVPSVRRKTFICVRSSALRFENSQQREPESYVSRCSRWAIIIPACLRGNQTALYKWTLTMTLTLKSCLCLPLTLKSCRTLALTRRYDRVCQEPLSSRSAHKSHRRREGTWLLTPSQPWRLFQGEHVIIQGFWTSTSYLTATVVYLHATCIHVHFQGRGCVCSAS